MVLTSARRFVMSSLAWIALLLPGLVALAAPQAAMKSAAGGEPLLPTPVLAPLAPCEAEFISVSTPLTDLGNTEYIRMSTGPTGAMGGLYPGGTNARPADHEAAGISIAQTVTPLTVDGIPDPSGRIVMLSIGMSNTYGEYQVFVPMARALPEFNRRVALVNGAQPGMVATYWVDRAADTWVNVNNLLASGGLSQLQVQVAWVKLTDFGMTKFPSSALLLRDHLKAVVRNIKFHYPNIRLVYLSSRTMSYTYWEGLNPEPGAFETGFSVKWLIEQQLNGDPELNYDPVHGEVVAPYLSWGPYIWVNGPVPRSDGQVWLLEDLVGDCTHPSWMGNNKVANQLLNYFKTDVTSRPWFLLNSFSIYIPLVTVQ